MANKFLSQFTAKTTPVLADIIYVGDSSNSFSEVKSTIGQIITNNKIITTDVTPTASNLPVWSASTVIEDSGITVDHSQNITNVNTITLNIDPTLAAQAATKRYADTKLAIANNLSDLGSASVARTNLGLGTAATKNSSSSDATVASVHGSITSGHIAVFNDTSGTITDGGSSSQYFAVANNLSEGVPATMRTNLGLGQAAVKGVTSNSQPNVASVTGSFTAGHILTAADSSGTVQDGGSSAQFLVAANNLSDVATKATAFNNVSPATTTGDLIYFSSGNNLRLPIGNTNYVLTVVGGVPTWAPAALSSGFVDNAVFVSNNTTFPVDITNPALNIGILKASTPSNTWALNGDNTGMKCNQTGSYAFSVTVPYQVYSGSTFGVIITQMSKNGTLTGPQSTINPIFTSSPSGYAVWQATLYHIISCNSGDVIRVNGTCGATPSPATYQQTGISDGVMVSIIRLT